MEHQRPRLKRRDPLSSKTKAATPAPADPQFVYLLRQTSLPSKRKAAFLDLAEFVSDALRATDLDGTGHLVRRLLAARDIGRLNRRDARFVTDMARVTRRYPATVKQRQWLDDIAARLDEAR
jgi:hypothetical protein